MAEHSLLLYALSTCIHCKRAKNFLSSHNVKYDIIHVDMLNEHERYVALEDMTKYNPNNSYPTLIIDGGVQVIVGFKENDYEELCKDE